MPRSRSRAIASTRREAHRGSGLQRRSALWSSGGLCGAGLSAHSRGAVALCGAVAALAQALHPLAMSRVRLASHATLLGRGGWRASRRHWGGCSPSGRRSPPPSRLGASRNTMEANCVPAPPRPATGGIGAAHDTNTVLMPLEWPTRHGIREPAGRRVKPRGFNGCPRRACAGDALAMPLRPPRRPIPT